MERQKCCQIGLKQPQLTVVMVPFPAHGHINQLLHLSRLISSYGIPVHFAGSTVHNRQAKLRVHGWDLETSGNIQFHDFQLLLSTHLPLTPMPGSNFQIISNPFLMLLHISAYLCFNFYRNSRLYSGKLSSLMIT